jgi:oligopeptide/dipeptide ABC transporter ATP-binding protein
VFGNPEHPYTEALMSAIPVADPERERVRVALRGELPSPLNPPAGCPFHPRCLIAATGVCDVEVPQLASGGDDPEHLASCHLRTGAHQDLDPERRIRQLRG